MDNRHDDDILDRTVDAVKKTVSVASSPVKKYIIMGILSILPYIAAVVFALLVIVIIKMAVFEQIDEVYDKSGKLAEDIGNRIANAITLHGFKTNEERDADEEADYYKRLKILEEMYKLSNYDISLLNSTVLYEANSEDLISISYSDDFLNKKAQKEFGTSSGNGGSNLSDAGSINLEKPEITSLNDLFNSIALAQDVYKSFLKTFFKNIGTKFSIGFVNGITMASQYEKANKSVFPVATAIKKCKDLTKDSGIKKNNMVVNMTDEFKSCYTGYLIAENNDDIYYLYFLPWVDQTKSSVSFVKSGEFKLFDSVAITESDIFKSMFNTIKYNIYYTMLGADSSSEMANQIFVNGCLMGKNDLTDTCNVPISGFNGYIVNNLQEFYKYNRDYGDNVKNFYINDMIGLKDFSSIEIANFIAKYNLFYANRANNYEELVKRYTVEDKNKRAIASDIIETTDAYFELTYGQVEARSRKNNSTVIAGNEVNAGVIIDSDGNSISFDDYVLLNVLASYSDEIEEIISSGNNVDERLRALVIMARTQIYNKTGFSSSDVNINGDQKVYELGLEIYNSYKENNGQIIDKLRKLIEMSRGKVVKSNTGTANISTSDVNRTLSLISNSGTIEDVIGNVNSNYYFNNFYFPLSDGGYHVTSYYGELRDSGPHYAYDYGAAYGTGIYSISDGVVYDIVNTCTNSSGSGCGGGFGNRVYVAYQNGDGNTYYVIYAHMSGVSGDISVGDEISAGSLLGYVGSTGSSTGNHLHLEIRVNGTDRNDTKVNPSDVFTDIDFSLSS